MQTRRVLGGGKEIGLCLVQRLKPAGSKRQVVLIESAGRCKRSDPHAVFRKTQTLLGRNLMKRQRAPFQDGHSATPTVCTTAYPTWRHESGNGISLDVPVGFAGLR